MKSIFRSRRNKSPHNQETSEKEGTPFFGKESKTPFFSSGVGAVQAKLTVGQPGDKYEKEADTMADAVVNNASKPAIQNKEISGIQRESLATPQEDEKLGTAEQRMEEDKMVQEKALVQRAEVPKEEEKPEPQKMEAPKEEEKPEVQKMEPPEEEEEIQTKSNGSNPSASTGVAQQIKAKSGKGSRLPKSTRAEMEASFGTDFSEVNVHTDEASVGMNEELGAQAFTHGSDVYFNSGKYDPQSRHGKHLLAHELTHVVQQSNGRRSQAIQKEGMGDLRMAEACDQIISDIQGEAAYKALAPDPKIVADEIIAEVNKRKQYDRYQYLIKLKQLFQTAEKSEADVTTETNVSTTAAVKEEKARIVKPKAVKNLNLEEKASQDPLRKWIGIKGKFGGGTYYVDNTSATNIVVRAKIFLKPAGTGTAGNVRDIKNMEDGIEKAASTKGYLVDVQFVNNASDPDTFTVEVNPGAWEVATNWSGGDPVGYAHELHHMFAFELDRYNYIEAHSTNESMKIPDRLHWFREELKKPAGYNNPTSIMNSATHPNDSDACKVAGLDEAKCMADRKNLVTQ